MGTRFPTFIQSLAGLDWRMAITTTDATSIGTDFRNGRTDGLLLNFGYLNGTKRTFTNRFYVDAQTPDVNNLFLQTVQRTGFGESGSPTERAVYTSFRSIERHLSQTECPDFPITASQAKSPLLKTCQNDSFIRSNANLALVILSDEDEMSSGIYNSNGTIRTGVDMRDVPENLLAFIKHYYPSKRTTAHAIIKRPGDKSCRTGASYGDTYAKLVSLTTGILGNICAEDYGAQLHDIAGSIQDSFESYKLQCAPVNNDVVVNISPAQPSSVITIVGDVLSIKPRLLPNSKVTLSYKCFTDPLITQASRNPSSEKQEYISVSAYAIVHGLLEVANSKGDEWTCH